MNAVLGPTLAQEFGLNATELGFLTGVYFCSCGLFQHPGKGRAAPLAGQLAGLGRILRDGAFWRVALPIGASRCAAVSLFTLWMTAWLR